MGQHHHIKRKKLLFWLQSKSFKEAEALYFQNLRPFRKLGFLLRLLTGGEKFAFFPEQTLMGSAWQRQHHIYKQGPQLSKALAGGALVL